MTQMEIFLNADGMLEGTPIEKVVRLDIERIGRLSSGTDGGRSSVSVTATLPDGRVVLLETTLRLLVQAVDLFKAHDALHDATPPAQG